MYNETNNANKTLTNLQIGIYAVHRRLGPVEYTIRPNYFSTQQRAFPKKNQETNSRLSQLSKFGQKKIRRKIILS